MAAKRLFFGIAIPEKQQLQIAQWQKQLAAQLPIDCKPVALSNLHITLAFLGNVSNQQECKLVEAVSQLQANQFTIEANGVALFNNAKVLHIPVIKVEPNMLHLVKQLKVLSHQAGLQLEQQDYRPHISLYRKANSLPIVSDNLKLDSFVANEFQLYHSQSDKVGVTYQAIDHWPLNPNLGRKPSQR